MKTITQLTGQLSTTDHQEPRGFVQGVFHEVEKGVFISLGLGAGGLIIRRREVAVAFPLEELLRVAAANAPELITPAARAAAAPSVPKPRTNRAAKAVRAVAAALLLLALTASAQQVFPRTNSLASGVVTNGTVRQFDVLTYSTIYRDRPVGIFAHLTSTNSNTDPISLNFDVAASGTNFTTTHPFVWTITPDGTNRLVYATNFPASLLDGVKNVRLTSADNTGGADKTTINVYTSIIP
jgi:hypothetical protein